MIYIILIQYLINYTNIIFKKKQKNLKKCVRFWQFFALQDEKQIYDWNIYRIQISLDSEQSTYSKGWRVNLDACLKNKFITRQKNSCYLQKTRVYCVSFKQYLTSLRLVYEFAL